jgi:hypothetical protein
MVWYQKQLDRWSQRCGDVVPNFVDIESNPPPRLGKIQEAVMGMLRGTEHTSSNETGVSE